MLDVNPRQPLWQPPDYSNERTVDGRDHMIRIMGNVANELIGEAETPIQQVFDNRDNYRFRYREGGFLNRGIVGTATENGFYNMVRAWVHHAIKVQLESQQPNGVWRVCGWRIVEVVRRHRHKVHNPNQNWDRFAEDPSHYGHGTPNPQKSMKIWKADPKLVLQLAFFDEMQADEIDNWYERTGKENSSLRKYLKTKEPRHLPPSFRKQRDKAIELMSEFLEKKAKDPELMLLSDDAVDLTPIVAEMRQRKVGWKRISALTKIDVADLKAMIATLEVNDEESAVPGHSEARIDSTPE